MSSFRNARIVTGFVLAVASLSGAAQKPWTVRPDGVGPIKIGMSLDELNKTLNASFLRPKPEEMGDVDCFYVEPSGHPGLGLMILEGRLVRVDVNGSDIATSRGIRNGDSEARVRAAYGKEVKASNNIYTDEPYLTWLPPHAHYGIRFETDHGKIYRFYAGQPNAIALIEGCS